MSEAFPQTLLLNNVKSQTVRTPLEKLKFTVRMKGKSRDLELKECLTSDRGVLGTLKKPESEEIEVQFTLKDKDTVYFD